MDYRATIVTHQPDVPCVLKLALNERAHLGVFFPCVECWPCGEAELEIGTTGLSECRGGGLVIKDVVY